MEPWVGVVVEHSMFGALWMLILLSTAVAGSDKPPLTAGFDFPIGPPDATGYYDAQPFGRNDHLGSDWNGKGGGNSDLGDPVYVIAPGIVTRARDFGAGWGNVVMVMHRYLDASGDEQWVESMYAHLDTMSVSFGDQLSRGDRLGTIGDAHGMYWAHLHFEIRSQIGMPPGVGYGVDTKGYLDPTSFIRAHPVR